MRRGSHGRYVDGVIASESVQDAGDVKHEERKEKLEGEEVEVNSQRSQQSTMYRSCHRSLLTQLPFGITKYTHCEVYY
jgi:hypothetical protein